MSASLIAAHMSSVSINPASSDTPEPSSPKQDRGRTASQNASNRTALRRLSVQPHEPAEAWIADTLKVIDDALRAGADRLTETTGLSTGLSRLLLAEKLRKAMRSTVEWTAGEARADGETLANIAEAAQLSLPSLRRTFPSLDDVVEARRTVEETGEASSIQVHGRRFAITSERR